MAKAPPEPPPRPNPRPTEQRSREDASQRPTINPPTPPTRPPPPKPPAAQAVSGAQAVAVEDEAPLRTLADLGTRLNVRCGKAVRRALDRAMANDPGLRVTLRGRSILFTPEQLTRTIKALEWRSPCGNAARSGTRAAPSASAGRRSPSQNSAQDAVEERMLKLLRRK